jgi:hypothetical protein
MYTGGVPVVSGSAGGLGYGGLSGFCNVDATPAPQAYVDSLQRRAEAALYDSYRVHVSDLLATTQGVICDVGCGIGSRTGCGGGGSVVDHGRECRGWCSPSQRGCSVIGPRIGGSDSDRTGLQHCGDIETVLDQARACLGGAGLVLCIDPVHAMSTVVIEGEQDLCERVVAWRRTHGVACPDAAKRAECWGAERGTVEVAEFDCDTNEFSSGRMITDFPNWARHARCDGWAVSESEVLYWEALCGEVAAGTVHFDLCLSHPADGNLAQVG